MREIIRIKYSVKPILSYILKKEHGSAFLRRDHALFILAQNKSMLILLP